MQEKRKEKKRKRKSKEKNQKKPQVVREFEIILSAYWYIKGYFKCKTPWHWLQFLSGGNILYPFTKVGLLSTERAVVSDKHRQDCWQERFLTRVQFVRTSKTVISYHPVWVRWCQCLECNPSSSLNQERKANCENCGWQFLPRASQWMAASVASYRNKSTSIYQQLRNTTQLSRYAGLPAQVQDTTGSTNGNIMEEHVN